MAFVKGTSGNPGGRPKKDVALSALLQAALAEKGANGIPKRKMLMNVLLNMALGGDLDAIKVVLDRSDGKVVERQEISGPGGAPVRVENLIDLSRLTDTDLNSLESLVGKATADPH